MNDPDGVRLQTPPKPTKRSLHKTMRRVLGKIGELMKNRTRSEILNNSYESEQEMYLSIFNESRKEFFLENLQESILTHAAMRDRAEKLAAHLGISVGDATNQLKAHMVEVAGRKKKGNPVDQATGMRMYDTGGDDLVPGRTKQERLARVAKNIDSMKNRKKLPESITECFHQFIADYESVLAENGISEYDLDEATEYFVEEYMPLREERIINEGIEMLLSEKMSVDEFISYLEEGAAVQVKRGASHVRLHAKLGGLLDTVHEAGKVHEQAKAAHENNIKNNKPDHVISASAAHVEQTGLAHQKAQRAAHEHAMNIVASLRKPA